MKKSRVGGLISRFKKLLQTYNSQDRMFWYKYGHVGKWKRLEGPEISPHIYVQLIFDSVPIELRGETMVFSGNGTGTNGYTHAK